MIKNLENIKEYPRVETPKDTAEILNVKQSAVRAWIHQGRLPVVRIGRRVFVKEDVIRRILDRGLEAVADRC